MKKLGKFILASSTLFNIFACQNTVVSSDNLEQQSQIQSNLKADVYPFDVKKDFYPLYEGSNWKYEIFDKNKKLLGTSTKSVNSNSLDSIESDKKNNYFIISMKKDQNVNTNEKSEFEQIRRQGNKLAFGRYDNPLYYPSGSEKITKAFDPYLFRPFVDFAANNKTETIKVKAGTFQCVKTEFTINLDAFTIWYAKDIGEIKRIKESSYGNYFNYELSEYNLPSKNFVIKKDSLSLDKIPTNIKYKAELAKKEYLKINQLPEGLFDSSSFLGFATAYVSHDNIKNLYDISYVSKSLAGKDNVRLQLSLDHESNIKNMSTLNENNEKSTYKGTVVDKIPTTLL